MDARIPNLTSPVISIVLCNYNHGAFLSRAIESATSQTYSCEVIVVDDGSTDNSRDIIATWAEKIKIILQQNQGQRAAYNAGFHIASGDIVIFLDADDFLDVDAAELVSKVFSENVVKAHFRLRLVDSDGRILPGNIPRRLEKGEQLANLIDRGLFYASAPGSGNAYRSSILRKLFPIPVDGTSKHGADFFTIYGVICLGGELAVLDQELASYRVHQRGSQVISQLGFGNQKNLFAAALAKQRQADQFRHWIFDRTDGKVRIPAVLHDFSNEKVLFSIDVIESSYLRGLAKGFSRLPTLFRSLWISNDFSNLVKIALSGWAIAVMSLPRVLGRPLARYVTNPASRGEDNRGITTK